MNNLITHGIAEDLSQIGKHNCVKGQSYDRIEDHEHAPEGAVRRDVAIAHRGDHREHEVEAVIESPNVGRIVRIRAGMRHREHAVARNFVKDLGDFGGIIRFFDQFDEKV